MAKSIQDNNVFYNMLSPLVQFGTRCHYQRFEVHGLDNLPQDGAYIIAPCHQQALMEPPGTVSAANTASAIRQPNFFMSAVSMLVGRLTSSSPHVLEDTARLPHSRRTKQSVENQRHLRPLSRCAARRLSVVSYGRGSPQ